MRANAWRLSCHIELLFGLLRRRILRSGNQFLGNLIIGTVAREKAARQSRDKFKYMTLRFAFVSLLRMRSVHTSVSLVI